MSRSLRRKAERVVISAHRFRVLGGATCVGTWLAAPAFYAGLLAFAAGCGGYRPHDPLPCGCIGGQRNVETVPDASGDGTTLRMYHVGASVFCTRNHNSLVLSLCLWLCMVSHIHFTVDDSLAEQAKDVKDDLDVSWPEFLERATEELEG